MIKESFNPNIPLTVHWDGKLLLGIPKLPSGTSQAMSKAVIDCLEDWIIKDRIQAMSFDTTSSNTGFESGAYILLEEMVGSDLLHYACCHHIVEIVVVKVLFVSDIPSTGPDILLFKCF